MDLSRLEILLTKQGIKNLKNSSVSLIGVGGVGSFCAEAICRCGIGHIAVCDGDVVANSNMNRQLMATSKTLGKKKVEVLAKRLLEINPELSLDVYKNDWHKENDFIKGAGFDYVIDAIDSVKDKLDLIELCYKNSINIISSMGAGNRLNSSDFIVDDIFKTYNDPLAKKVRYELKKRGIDKLDVVFSKELPKKPEQNIIGSAVFTTGSAGLKLASHVIIHLAGLKEKNE